MAEAAELQRQLLSAQNLDGGWGYQRGISWVEPTALALLALEAQQVEGDSHARAYSWLSAQQRSDGGWGPQQKVKTSTWVTSLVTLALSDVTLTPSAYRRAIEWTTRQIRPDLSPLERFLFRMRGMPPGEETSGGSPWFPGTAAWIGPTVMATLALSDAIRRTGDQQLKLEVQRGREYILSRRCDDGGWNHGGTRFRSQTADSYPEMTGMALLALHGTPESELSPSLQCAEARLKSPGSMEALSWLQLGLMKHGRDRLDIKTDLECRTTRDVCLRLLALNARSRSNKLLIEGC